MRLQKLASDWKTYVALVAAAATAMSAFTDLVTKAGEAISGFKDLPPEARWFVAAVFLVITVVFLLAALSRRSQLLKPERFLLSSENPAHLAGREEEVAHLARQCGRHSLIFLVGDSGTGKSSLVRAGLAHGLLAQDSAFAGHDFVPLVVDLSGVGWQRGLSLALARALGRLPEDTWKTLGGGDRPAADTLFRWLRIRPAHAPRRLLLILDQFDDYLALHRAQFYDGTTLRKPEEIEKLSADWHGLAELLRNGSVTVLVVARSEAAGSLPALCFVEDAAIAREHLTRLPGNLVAPLLHRLSEPVDGQPVVSDPEFGWLQLRLRLLRDLEAAGDGQILPIQLAVALNSLRLSRYLTPTEYERQGGLRGLERLHVERHAERAAAAARVPTATVLEALLTLVSPDGSKTRPVSRADFDAVLGRHGATPEAAARAILQLEDDRLLRRVLADGVESETLLLYHDYLARGVREAYRQANQWTELLRERAQLFQEALGWRQRWRALLTPAEQTRLLWERFRGRFSFDERLRFFGLSAARCLPLALVLLLVGFGGWEVDRYRRNQIAAEVMQAIGHGDSVTEEEARQLLRLSAAGYDAGAHALRLAIGNPTIARRASERLDQLVSLVVGLDPHGERSSALVDDIVGPALKSTQTNFESAAFAAAIASKLRLSPAIARQIAQSITVRVQSESDIETLVNLSGVLGSLSAKLERRDVTPAAAILVERMKTASADDLANLGRALGSLSAKLERQDVVPGAAALVTRMKIEPDSATLSRLGSALGSLSVKLKKQDITHGAAALVARIKTENNDFALVNLLSALASMTANLEMDEQFIDALLHHPRVLAALGQPNLAPLESYAGLGSAALVARMKTESDSETLASLGKALGSLSTNLERQDVAQVAAALVAKMKAEPESSKFASLGQVLGSFSANLGDAGISVVPGFNALVTRAGREWDEEVLAKLTQSLVALGPTLPTPVILSVYPHPVRVEQVYVDLLKSAFVVGDARAELLKGLEQATGQTFAGDLWSFVEWATETDAGRALELDLEGRPPWLDAGGE